MRSIPTYYSVEENVYLLGTKLSFKIQYTILSIHKCIIMFKLQFKKQIVKIQLTNNMYSIIR